LTLVT